MVCEIQAAGEVSLRAGEYVSVELSEGDWSYGTTVRGEAGWFPAASVVAGKDARLPKVGRWLRDEMIGAYFLY